MESLRSHRRRFVALAAVLLAVFCATTTSAQTPAESPAGRVKKIQGEAQVESAGAVRRLEEGAAVHAGDRIRTTASSAVGITLRDGSTLSLGPLSSATVLQFEYEPTTRSGVVLLQVFRGAARVVTGLIARAEPRAHRVQTATATIGVRGTDFIVEVPALEGQP